jgi:hypothetical protein
MIRWGVLRYGTGPRGGAFVLRFAESLARRHGSPFAIRLESGIVPVESRTRLLGRYPGSNDDV